MNEEDMIRSAAEALLVTLHTRFPVEVRTQLLEMLHSVQRVSLEASSDTQLRITDGVYKAMGVLAFGISDHVDFTSWFMTSLAPILQVFVEFHASSHSCDRGISCTHTLFCTFPTSRSMPKQSVMGVVFPQAVVDIARCSTKQSRLCYLTLSICLLCTLSDVPTSQSAAMLDLPLFRRVIIRRCVCLYAL